MEILARFALVIHWVSFATGIILGLILTSLISLPEADNFQKISAFILGLFSFISCSAMGWLARYVLVGKIHFLPWKKLSIEQ